ncbi:MAG: hypothetical protein CL471_18745 [Acidobacteria bacterium]|nr:hypothetical protein [Acidobacteriota bacterium]
MDDTIDPPTPPLPSTPPSSSTAVAVRIRAFVEVVLCSDFPTQLIVIQVLAWIGLHPLLDNGGLSLTYVATLSLVDAAALIALMFWLMRRRGESAREAFLGARPIGREARLGILLVPGIVLFVLVSLLLIQRFAPALHNVAVNPLESLLETPRDIWIFAVVAIVAGGLREELQRAFILRRFEQHLGGARVGLVVFSIAFGAGHLLQGWDAAIVTAMLGLVWGIVFLARRSVVAPLVSHACFNLSEIVRHVAVTEWVAG